MPELAYAADQLPATPIGRTSYEYLFRRMRTATPRKHWASDSCLFSSVRQHRSGYHQRCISSMRSWRKDEMQRKALKTMLLMCGRPRLHFLLTELIAALAISVTAPLQDDEVAVYSGTPTLKCPFGLASYLATSFYAVSATRQGHANFEKELAPCLK